MHELLGLRKGSEGEPYEADRDVAWEAPDAPLETGDGFHGCFYQASTVCVSNKIERPLTDQKIDDRIEKLRKFAGRLPDEHRELFNQELDILSAEIYAGTDRGAVKYLDGSADQADGRREAAGPEAEGRPGKQTKLQVTPVTPAGAPPVTDARRTIDSYQTGDRATIEYRNRNALRVNVDATGVGAGIGPHMQRLGCSAVSIKVASSPTEKTELGEFQILRDQLWWACREWLRIDSGAMLPPDEVLIEELQTPTYTIANGKIRVMKKDVMRELLRRSPDRADALCLTFAPSGIFGLCDLT
jgi:hypothetical protein